MEKSYTLEFEKENVTISWQQLDNIDAEDMLYIRATEIIGELVTFPIYLNRVRLAKVEIVHIHSVKKKDLGILTAQIAVKLRGEYDEVDDNKGGTKLVKKTEKQIEQLTILDDEHQIETTKLLDIERSVGVVDAFLWSAISKDKKLDTISAKIKSEEFEADIINRIFQRDERELTINGVKLTRWKPLMTK